MTATPLVSIYMPTKNRRDRLELAVNSVLRQSYANVELIVVDDGSTDDTPSYLAAASAADSRVRYMRNEKSAGACAARNKAILTSGGEFVTGLDDDDEFEAAHIGALVRHWHFLSELSLTQSALYVQYKLKNKEAITLSSKKGSVGAEDMFEANHVGNQIFAPRNHFIEAGLFDEGMPAWQDVEFFYRVLKRFGHARLLDIPSYVFDIAPRPDRISSHAKDKIMHACSLMYEKHGRGDKRLMQQLLLQQVFSFYYDFPVRLADVRSFFSYGFWPDGYALILRKYLRSSLRHR